MICLDAPHDDGRYEMVYFAFEAAPINGGDSRRTAWGSARLKTPLDPKVQLFCAIIVADIPETCASLWAGGR